MRVHAKPHRWSPGALLPGVTLMLVATLTANAAISHRVAHARSPVPDAAALARAILDTAPPTMNVITAGAPLSSQYLSVRVEWCDSQSPLNATTRRIIVNGVRTDSTFSYATATISGCRYATVSTDTITLRSGSNEIKTYICDNSSQHNCADTLYTLINYNPVIFTATHVVLVGVTPNYQQVPVEPSQSLTKQFVVRNNGDVQSTYTLRRSCTGSAFAIGCTPSTDSIVLAPYASAAVTLAATIGTTVNAVGMMRLTALARADTMVRDSGDVNVTITQGTPGVDVSSVNPDPSVERSLCLNVAVPGGGNECGDLQLEHAGPAVTVFGQTRAPVLVYNANHAHPFARVMANVTLPNDGQIPTTVSATLLVNGVAMASGSWPGSSWRAGSTRRVSLAYDASSVATGRYPYKLAVTRQYTSSSVTDTARSALVVVNRSQSPYGAGWWVAGLEQLQILGSDTLFWIGGDGSTRLYSRPTGNTGPWRAPNIDHPDSIYFNNALYNRAAPHRALVQFDANGRHVQTVSRLGRVTQFAYTSGGALQTITLPVPTGAPSRQFTLSYGLEQAGFLDGISATDGRTGTRKLEVHIDALHRVQRFVNPDARASTILFGFDSTMTQRIISRTGANGAITRYTFAAANLLAKASFALGGGQYIDKTFGPRFLLGLSGSAAVDPASDFAWVDGPRTDVGDTTWFWLDRFGAPQRIRDALGNETVITRGDSRWVANPTRIRGADGHITSAVYDSVRGNVASVTDSTMYKDAGSVRTYATTRYEWNTTWDLVRKIIPPEGDSTTFDYATTDGQRLWQQRGGDTVKYAYNGLRLVASTVLSNGAVDSITYDVLGNVASIRTALGVTTLFQKDGLGRDTLVVSPVNPADTTRLRSRTVYDVGGLDTLSVTWGGTDTIVVRKHFDVEGNIDSVAQHVYPDAAQPTFADSASRNGIGWIRRTFLYDNANRKWAEYGTGTTLTWSYDLAGNLLAGPREGSRQYDALGRMTRKIGSDTSRYTYDAGGRLQTANNRYARIGRRYFPSGLLKTDSLRIAVSDSAAVDFSWHVYGLQYDYDLSGRRTSLQYPAKYASIPTLYGYDYTSGQLAWMKDQNALRYRFHYNRLGQLDTLVRRDSTSSPLIEAMAYDLEGKLLSRVQTAAGVLIGGDSLGYDARGKIVEQHPAITGGFGATYDRMTYNAIGQLTHAELYTAGGREERNTVDALGNRRFVAVIAPHANSNDSYYYAVGSGRLMHETSYNGGTVDDTTDYAYDPDAGDLNQTRHRHTSITFNGGFSDDTLFLDQTTNNEYDGERRMVESDFVFDSTNTLRGTFYVYVSPETYRYDALGRRVWVRSIKGKDCPKVNASSGCHSTVTRTVWDGYQVAIEIRTVGSDTIPKEQLENDTPTGAFYGVMVYTHGGAIDQPLAIGSGGSAVHPFTNYRGLFDKGTCPTVLCSESTIYFPGKAASAYGAGASLSNGPPSWFGSLIEGQIDASGLMYRRNRYYDPASGRFTQEDPIGLSGGSNLYGYASGDPVNYSDPFGLWPGLGMWLDGGWRNIGSGIRLTAMLANVHANTAKMLPYIVGASLPLGGAEEASVASTASGGAVANRIAGQLGQIEKSLGNIVDELKTHDHFEAAELELSGGKTFGDHVHELRDFANGLRDSAMKLQRMLGADGLSPEIRERIQATLSTVSNLRDAITKVIGK